MPDPVQLVVMMAFAVAGLKFFEVFIWWDGLHQYGRRQAMIYFWRCVFTAACLLFAFN